MKAGRATVFEGVTDGSGRFVTPLLEPGVYTFEVRIPKGFVSSARYFLALSGAKPLGEAMTSPRVPLTMEAQVRRPTSVRGQVTGRRGAVAPTVASSPGATPATSMVATGPVSTTVATARTATPADGARSATSGRSAAPPVGAPVSQGLSPRPPGFQPRIIDGRRHYWVPIAPGSTLGRWMPERNDRPRTTAAPSATAQSMVPRTMPSPSPSPRQR